METLFTFPSYFVSFVKEVASLNVQLALIHVNDSSVNCNSFTNPWTLKSPKCSRKTFIEYYFGNW